MTRQPEKTYQHLPLPEDDSGFIGLWFVGLWSILLFALSGILWMHWQTLNQYTEATAVADTAAITAAAGGIDIDEYRTSRGENIVLDPPLTEEIARQVLQAHGRGPDTTQVTIEGQTVTVRISDTIDPLLLRIFRVSPIIFEVRGTAVPMQSE